MKLHELDVVYVGETLQANVDSLAPTDPLYARMLTRRAKYNPHCDVSEFIPLDRVTLHPRGGRLHLRGHGIITLGQLPSTVHQVLVGKTPQGWKYLEDTVDPRTKGLEIMDPTFMEMVATTFEGMSFPISLLVGHLDSDPNQHWGYITFPLMDSGEELFFRNASQIPAAYHYFEHFLLGRRLLDLWERLHATYQHHTARIIQEDLLHDFNPVPILFLTTPHLYYMQALVFSVRWLGIEPLVRLLSKDPYLVFLTLYWSTVLIQSHAFQEALRSHPVNGEQFIDHVLSRVAEYLSQRRGDTQPPVIPQSMTDHTETISFTPISPLVDTYLTQVLDRLQLEGFCQ